MFSKHSKKKKGLVSIKFTNTKSTYYCKVMLNNVGNNARLLHNIWYQGKYAACVSVALLDVIKAKSPKHVCCSFNILIYVNITK